MLNLPAHLPGDPNIAPNNLPIPKEADKALRTSDSITFIFHPIGQALSRLVIQAMQVTAGKQAYADGFSPSQGGIEVAGSTGCLSIHS